MRDVERWIGRSVTIIKSAKYADIDDVFQRTKYMAGIGGARCTTELKKLPRVAWQDPDDIHVFGYTADEAKRADDFEDGFGDNVHSIQVPLLPPLQEQSRPILQSNEFQFLVTTVALLGHRTLSTFGEPP